MKDDPWNRCDYCGQFIPMEDFADQSALRHMMTPDSCFTAETWRTLCAKCNTDVAATEEGK